MWRWLFRRSSARAKAVIALWIAILGVMVSYHYGGKTVPWKFFQSQRRESDAALAQGRDFLQKGKFRRAIQAVSVIPGGTAGEAEALTIRGISLANLEEVGPARQVLERAWRLRPNAMAAKVLAAIYLAANETQRGLHVLEAAAVLAPDDFRPWYAMGDVYLRCNRNDEAVDAFRRALERNPKHLESRVGLIEALVKSHHPDEAEPMLQSVLRERPDAPRVLVLAAGIAVERGREQDATRYLEQTLAFDPDHREALVLRARSRFRSGRFQEALPDAERALALEPNDLGVLDLLGSLQSALGLKELAAATLARRRQVERRTTLMNKLKEEIDQRPNDPEPRWRLGQAAAEAGMTPLAVQCYQAALARAPHCEQAREGLLKLGVH